jgi:hypothetical protein
MTNPLNDLEQNQMQVLRLARFDRLVVPPTDFALDMGLADLDSPMTTVEIDFGK